MAGGANASMDPMDFSVYLGCAHCFPEAKAWLVRIGHCYPASPSFCSIIPTALFTAYLPKRWRMRSMAW